MYTIAEMYRGRNKQPCYCSKQLACQPETQTNRHQTKLLQFKNKHLPQTNRHQTKLLQFKNKQFLFVYSYPLLNRCAMAKASGAEVLVKHDDGVLIQLVLTQLAKCSPFPFVRVSQAD